MGGVFVNIEVNSTFLDEIKAKQLEDGHLNKLQNKVVCAETSNATLEMCGVLWFRGWIYVP